jgi:hypothetical protein
VQVKRAYYRRVQTYFAQLVIEFEEPELPDAVIDPECWKWFYTRRCDLVYLGGALDGHVSWKYPGRDWPGFTGDRKSIDTAERFFESQGGELRGFTDDPTVVRLAKQFCHDVNGGYSKPGRIE